MNKKSLVISIFAMLVPIFALIGTYKAHIFMSETVEIEEKDRFERKTHLIKASIQEQIDNYQFLMRKATHLDNGFRISPKKLLTFLDNNDLRKQYPGMTAIGYLIDHKKAIQAGEINRIKRSWKLTNKWGYSKKKKLNYPFVYSETIKRNLKLDENKFSKDKRITAALKLAAKTNKAVTIGLKTKKGRILGGNLLVIIPHYTKFSSIPSTEFNKKHSSGWIIGVINVPEMMNYIISLPDLRGLDKAIDIELFPTAKFGKKHLLFDSDKKIHSKTKLETQKFASSTPFNIGGLLLTLKLQTKPKYLPKEFRKEADIVLYSGGVVSLLLLIIAFSTITVRSRSTKIAENMSASFRESEARFRVLSEAAPIGIMHINIDGNCIYVNRHWMQLTNKTFQDAMGNGWIKSIEHNDRVTVIKEWEKSAKFLTEHKSEFRLQLSVVNKPWVSFQATPIVDPQGNLTGFVGTWKDITLQKNAELAAEKENRSLLSIIENAPVAMAMLNTELQYVAHSSNWQNIFGSSKDSLISKRFEDTCPATYRPLQDKMQWSLVKGEIQQESEAKFDYKGETSFLNWAIHPTKSSDGVVQGVVMVAHQITELVDARLAAENAAKFKEKFLANMSHEIRTPLNGVMGMIELLQTTSLDTEQAEYAGIVNSSSQNLLAIINDILDLSKIESGKLNLERIEFNFRELIEDTAMVFAQKAQSKGLEIISDIQASIDTTVCGDSVRIGQILTNLIGNAIKFTPKGSVVIYLEEKESKDGKVLLEIGVKDSGIGVSEEAQKGLFDAFTQAEESTTRKFGGTGLGLNISKQLVERMGGNLSIRSKLGSGSTFWFQTWFDIEQDRASDIPVAALIAPKRILFVDPSEFSRKIIDRNLNQLNFNCRSVGSHAEAVELLGNDTSFEFLLITAEPQRENAADLRNTYSSVVLGMDIKVLCLVPLTQKQAFGDYQKTGFVNGLVNKPLILNTLITELDFCLHPDKRSASASQFASLKQAPNELRSNVLVVDDNEINRKYAVTVLRRLGIRSATAVNGQEAVEMARAGTFELILMDCRMPILDGFGATEQIRAFPDDKKNIPIVAMTAGAMANELDRCKKCGMNETVLKPIKLAEFKAMLDRWINLSENIGSTTPTILTAAPASSQPRSNHPTQPAPELQPAASLATQSSESFDDVMSSLNDISEDAPVTPSNPHSDTIDDGMITEWKEALQYTDDLLYSEIILPFLGTANESVNAMDEALKALDMKNLERVSHGMGSSAGTVGAKVVMKICRKIESDCNQKANSDYAFMITSLRKELALYENLIKVHLDLTSKAG